MASSESTSAHSDQAYVPWGKLWIDVVLLVAGVLVMILSCAIDSTAAYVDWFPRSGAVAVLFSGILAYRSLTKHYQKFFNDTQRGHALKTSRNQWIVDCSTIALSAIGTLVWAYGDKIR